VFVITDLITRGFFFKTLTENEPERRREYAFRIAAAVAIILGISAVAGREILDIIGINLGAFGVAGGLVVVLMGFEMLFGGEPSRAQGGEEAHEEPNPESFEGQVLVPYAMPFVAGPGAITLVISIAAGTSDASGALAALVAVAIAVILLPIGHLLIAQKLNLSDNTMKIATKMGGLLIATIGIQLMLSGIQTYFSV
jgi:multiple antibiotic resistance protein